MTTPRIEEKKGRKIGEDEYTEHWSLDGHSYIQVPKWVIIQTHQAGIDEAVDICWRYCGTDASNNLEDAIKQERERIKPLQDKK